MTKKKIRPFLKWAGNKIHILQQLLPILPKANHFVEPFVGSGAVFMNTNYPNYCLADSNPDLILVYQILQKEGNKFINYTKKFFLDINNQADVYYQLRERFNSLGQTRQKAALFIYLNRHGYNGLCRYNRNGMFNVPFGSYTTPYFPEQELLGFYNKLISCKVKLICQDFRNLLNNYYIDDSVIYCDPPYLPINQQRQIFTSYAANQFTFDDQQELVNLAKQQKQLGNLVILSNHDTNCSRQLLAEASLISSFKVARFISCKSSSRKPVSELLAIYHPTNAVPILL